MMMISMIFLLAPLLALSGRPLPESRNQIDKNSG